jgi:hypothetical protein
MPGAMSIIDSSQEGNKQALHKAVGDTSWFEDFITFKEE